MSLYFKNSVISGKIIAILKVPGQNIIKRVILTILDIETKLRLKILRLIFRTWTGFLNENQFCLYD